MENQKNINYNDLPLWVQMGGMVKNIFPEVMKEKNKINYLELCSNADTLLNVTEMLYEKVKEELEEKIEAAVKSRDAFSLRQYVEHKTQLIKDYKFAKKLYSSYKDIAVAGFDFYEKLNEYTKEVQNAMENNINLKMLPSYSTIRPIYEYIVTAQTVLSCLTQMEQKHRSTTDEISKDQSLKKYYKAHLLEQEEYIYYHKSRITKTEWGCISGALKRAINGAPVIKVKKANEDVVFN